MQEPVFNDTLQIGIVVRDLEATVRRYEDDYGIGPWEVHEFNAGEAEDFHEYGQSAERSWRGATTMVGQVMWELIEPLDKEGVFARFLDEKGDGVHHVAVGVRDLDETVAAEARRGGELDLSGRFSGVEVAYLNTQRDLGVTIEIARGMPGDGEHPDAD